MPFASGRVTYCRLLVTGDAPSTVDETALSILHENRFQETEIGAPDEVEVGFVTGQHLFDTQFTFEKNGYGPGGSLLSCAMRMDTHKVPSEIKQAYKKINEQTAAADNPSGFASKAQKREANELASRQIHEDLASGKFRKSKSIPLLWDLKNKQLYCGAASNAVIEELCRLMRNSFACDLEYVSAGVAAGHLLRSSGKGRDYEDFKPSAFTKPPATATGDHEEADDGLEPRDLSIPAIPWVAQSVDMKDFLGNEFLIWLWWLSETNDGQIKTQYLDGREDQAFLAIDKALDMECAWDAGGKQTLRGHGPTRLIEAADALITGKWPRKTGFILSDGEYQWELTLQADKAIVSAAMLPEITDAQSPREITEQRLDLTIKLADTLDAMYNAFLSLRVNASAWPGKRDAIKNWIKARHPSKKASQPATAPQAEKPQPEIVITATQPPKPEMAEA